MVNHWSFFNQILRFIPHSCLLCEETARFIPLCTGCHADLPWNSNACSRCAIPLSPHEQGQCSDCLRHPPPQQFTLAPLRYEFPADHLISGLKYHGQLAHAPLLGQLLVDAAQNAIQQANIPKPDLLLPVPLHSRRLRDRGYNQALEIARPLARHWNIPLETGLIKRQRYTLPQMRLSAAARAKNPKNAFALHSKRASLIDPSTHIMLVDDVMTTGATFLAIASLLQQAGFTKLSLAAVARTP